jgi:hypothetical protein
MRRNNRQTLCIIVRLFVRMFGSWTGRARLFLLVQSRWLVPNSASCEHNGLRNSSEWWTIRLRTAMIHHLTIPMAQWVLVWERQTKWLCHRLFVFLRFSNLKTTVVVRYIFFNVQHHQCNIQHHRASEFRVFIAEFFFKFPLSKRVCRSLNKDFTHLLYLLISRIDCAVSCFSR